VASNDSTTDQGVSQNDATAEDMDIDLQNIADSAAEASASTAARPAPGLARFEVDPLERPSQNPPRTTADVRTADANNWQSFHEGQPHSSVFMSMTTKFERHDLDSLLLDCLQTHVSDIAQRASCPKCGSRPGGSQQGSPVLVYVVREVEVLLVTLAALVSVTVPVMACQGWVADGKQSTYHTAL
jgi:hypothetical protein